jgi:hypothetical protein
MCAGVALLALLASFTADIIYLAQPRGALGVDRCC